VVAIISAPGFDFTKVPKKNLQVRGVHAPHRCPQDEAGELEGLSFAEAHGLPGD